MEQWSEGDQSNAECGVGADPCVCLQTASICLDAAPAGG